MPTGLAPFDAADADRALRRELHFYTLYRLFEAALLVFFVFGPVDGLIESIRHDLFARSIALSYLFAAVLLFAFGRRGELRAQALTGIAADLSFGLLAMQAMPSADSGIALMLMFNIGAAALLLPPRYGLGAAALAVAGLIGGHAWNALIAEESGRSLAETIVFAIAYLAIAFLTSSLGREMRAGYDLAARRGAEAARLGEVNELIIRRLRTGVLLVDRGNHVRLANEAAMLLLGDPGEGEDLHGLRYLDVAAPELARRLERWRKHDDKDESPLQFAPDLPEVVPHFTRLLAGSDQVLIFLDDTSLLSRQAESITLATLGRFSASLAHEIRNPLAAINYAVQLLEESDDVPTAERRLLEIIRQQGMRMNGIVENVLGMARRQPAKPEHVELMGFVREFVDDYLTSHPLDHDTLHATGNLARLPAVADPRQLHQVLTALVHNALTYGRMPGTPARVNVHVHVDDLGLPTIDVLDRGPGIPESVATRLFRPFFTTSGHGTGLGLYIARELCRANQASLDYVPLPGGGSCFRIRLAGGSGLLQG